MAKSDFIPAGDNDFLIWLDHFINNLSSKLAEYGLSQEDLTELQTLTANFHGKVAAASEAAAISKQATADKNDNRRDAEAYVRKTTRQIKAHHSYTPSQGAKLGIEGPENTFDLSAAKPTLSGIDQTGGKVLLSFSKMKSDGMNFYCQREGDADWVLLGRATVSPFVDSRPLLISGKPELRRYTAVYMQKDQEIGQFSDDLVVNCAP